MIEFLKMIAALTIGFSIVLIVELLAIAYMDKHQKGDIHEQ
jgi:hypothetical protein